MIQIYTGNGKGKTTAALGLTLRAVGAGKRVAIVFFDKGGDHYSERDVLDDRFGDTVDWYATGLDRIDPETGRFRFGVIEGDIREAERGLELAYMLVEAGGHDVIVLDEVNTSVSLGMIDEQQVKDLLDITPRETELILTGRDAPTSFMAKADLVSETTEVKHYMRKGVPAREGIEF